MTYIDLFSGIGGFAIGAYRAGMHFDKHYFSEVDDYCCKLYSLRFPEAIPLGDISKIEFALLPKGNWIFTGGFPCQDISIVGKGEGISGKRSGLWFKMLRAIRILRPRFAIIENVGAITFRGLDTVLGTLAEIGYDAEWQDIRASDMGAPHRRERIWIIAYPNVQQRQIIQKRAIIKSKFWRDDSRYNILDDKENNDVSLHNICGVDDGLSEPLDRFDGLGNTIISQIAELLFRQIKELLND